MSAPRNASGGRLAWTALMALCGAGIVLTACSAIHTAAGQNPSPTTTDSVQRRPLDAYRFTREENVTMLSALQILEERCMSRYGFTLREAGAPYRPIDTTRPEVVMKELFGLKDPANGYGVPVTPEQAEVDARATENSAYFDSLPPMTDAYTLAFGGRYKRSSDTDIPASLGESIEGVDIYPTGCQGWAWDQLAPDDTSEGVSALVRELDPWNDAAADPRVITAEASWSSCMTTAGYTYARPDAIQEEDRLRQMESSGSRGVDAALKQEQYLRDVAPMDAECRATSGYAQVRFEVLSEYDDRVIEQNAPALTEYRAGLDAQVRRAAAVVAEAGW